MRKCRAAGKSVCVWRRRCCRIGFRAECGAAGECIRLRWPHGGSPKDTRDSWHSLPVVKEKTMKLKLSGNWSLYRSHVCLRRRSNASVQLRIDGRHIVDAANPRVEPRVERFQLEIPDCCDDEPQADQRLNDGGHTMADHSGCHGNALMVIRLLSSDVCVCPAWRWLINAFRLLKLFHWKLLNNVRGKVKAVLPTWRP